MRATRTGVDDGAGAGGGVVAELEPERFAREFRTFLETFNRLVPPEQAPLRDLLVEHFGGETGELPGVAEELASPEHPNLQLALDELTVDHGWRAFGLPLGLRRYGGFSLASLATNRPVDFGFPAPRPGPVEYVNVQVGPHETLPCAQLALYLGRWDDDPVALLVVAGDERHMQPTLTIEALATDRAHAQAFLARLRQRREDLNIYRGRTLSFVYNRHGRFGLDFLELPAIRRSDVILPEADLAAIEQHTIGITARAAALRATKRHLKRGLLLYGPPGTGKTWSVTYLRNAMPERTTMVINGGPGIELLGRAIALARSLQPAMVVVEDVDLIAGERTLPGRSNNPLLFQLLNEMDGLAEDADVIFVLTTNRLELLEPALAARPGRIDQAVEIKLPDPDCRRRLFELYLRDVPRGEIDLQPLVDATDGVSAAFVRELIRRAVLAAASDDDGAGGEDDGDRPPTVEQHHVTAALDMLTSARAPVLRTLLGATRPAD
jgi:ATPase family associated with various cellular activities (AAA)